MSNPFLNAAYVRSVLTRKIAALEASTRRKPSQPQVKQLNRLTRTYHGSLAAPDMKPETALEVLSDVSVDRSVELLYARPQRQTLVSTLSTLLKKAAQTAESITQNIK
jgi:hypothetical protein